jgi:hypothetical protein
VLHLCWRQRNRLLVELWAGVAAQEEEEKRLLVRLQQLAADRASARRRLPWHRRPATGLAVTSGSLAAAIAQWVLAAGIHDSALVALGAGCVWTVTALASAARAGADPEQRLVLQELRRTRHQREQLQRQIAQLEE